MRILFTRRCDAAPTVQQLRPHQGSRPIVVFASNGWELPDLIFLQVALSEMNNNTHSKLLQTKRITIGLLCKTPTCVCVCCVQGMAYMPCRKYILPRFHLQVQILNGSKLGANNDVVQSTHAGDLKQILQFSKA